MTCIIRRNDYLFILNNETCFNLQNSQHNQLVQVLRTFEQVKECELGANKEITLYFVSLKNQMWNNLLTS